MAEWLDLASTEMARVAEVDLENFVMERETDLKGLKCLNRAHAQSFDRCEARGRDSWCWPKGARPLRTGMN